MGRKNQRKWQQKVLHLWQFLTRKERRYIHQQLRTPQEKQIYQHLLKGGKLQNFSERILKSFYYHLLLAKVQYELHKGELKPLFPFLAFLAWHHQASLPLLYDLFPKQLPNSLIRFMTFPYYLLMYRFVGFQRWYWSLEKVIDYYKKEIVPWVDYIKETLYYLEIMHTIIKEIGVAHYNEHVSFLQHYLQELKQRPATSYMYYLIVGNLYFSLKEWQKALEYYLHLYDLLKKYGANNAIICYDRILARYNAMICCATLKKFALADRLLQEGFQEKIAFNVITILNRYLLHFAVIEISLRKHAYKEAQRAIEIVQQLIQRFPHLQWRHDQELILYNNAYLAFLQEDYQQSDKICKTYLLKYKRKHASHITTFFFLLSLATAYKMKDFDFLRYRVEAVHKWLIRKQRFCTFEQDFLHWIKLLIKYHYKEIPWSTLELFYNKACSNAHGNEYKGSLLYFDLLTWMERELKQLQLSG